MGCHDERTPQELEPGSNAEGTAKTGHGAWRTTRSVVLPRNASRTPWRPAVGIPMKSTSYSIAASTIDFTTSPDRRMIDGEARALVSNRCPHFVQIHRLTTNSSLTN